ncbi:MAG: hypothetical protein ACREOW_18055 [Thermodesulfobacteriota bacterium]
MRLLRRFTPRNDISVLSLRAEGEAISYLDCLVAELILSEADGFLAMTVGKIFLYADTPLQLAAGLFILKAT